MGIRDGIKFELYNCSKQILMASSRGTLMNRHFMSKQHILSGNTDSLRRFSTKLKEPFIQWLVNYLEIGSKSEIKNTAIWYWGILIIPKIVLVVQPSFVFLEVHKV